MDWHSDLPRGTEEIWDIMAKALLLRLGGSVTVSEAEMAAAAETECQMAIADGGVFRFRVETH